MSVYLFAPEPSKAKSGGGSGSSRRTYLVVRDNGCGMDQVTPTNQPGREEEEDGPWCWLAGCDAGIACAAVLCCAVVVLLSENDGLVPHLLRG